MPANHFSRAGPQSWPAINPGLGITDKGIVCGEGVILAHRAEGSGGSRMAPTADEDRLVALLSVMSGRPVARADVLHHVEAASAHWRRGDKALANFRLVFSGLPRPDTPAAAHRLRVAANLLDDGLSPAALMKTLWPEQLDPLGKYAPDQPRVPAGNGARSGEWEFWGGGRGEVGVADREGGRILVAQGEKKPAEADSPEFDEISGYHPPRRSGSESAETTNPFNVFPGGVPAKPDVTLTVSRSRFGEAAEHMLDAQMAGKPSILTVDRTAAYANRAAATGHLPKVDGKHLDEYPPAMFSEGGMGASVRAITPKHNQALGAYIGRSLRQYPDGSQVELKAVP